MRSFGSWSAGGYPSTQPLDGLRDPLLDPDPRLPAEQAPRLLDAGPAADDVDREGRLVLERERLGVATAGGPDDARDVGDRALVGRADVEVLVEAGRRGHRRDDPVGD